MWDVLAIHKGTFPTLRDEYGDPVVLTRRQELRVQRWCRLLLSLSNGLIESDPGREAQTRRLAAVFAEHDVEWFCELVQCRTGDKYPK